MVDAVRLVALFGAVAFALIIPFVVVPEILERRGHPPRAWQVRAVVWSTFLAIVFVPAAVSGYLTTVTNPVDWLLFAAAMAVAILWDYYRLNPEKVPWARRSG